MTQGWLRDNHLARRAAVVAPGRCRVQPIDRACASPAPPAIRSVKAARAREANRAMKEGPYGAESLTLNGFAVSDQLGKVGNVRQTKLHGKVVRSGC